MRVLITGKFLRNLILSLIALSAIGFFFSYKILEIPGELAADEASFGYNAVLLVESLHDQNGRFLPFFVLSSNGIEWRQPVPQYYIAAFFKIFGLSVFNLRFTSVVITLVSVVLIFYLTKELFATLAAFLASFIFLTTPQIMIQSHIAFDNITPVPFALLWLISVFYFRKTERLKYLLLAGVFLGIGFYTYKGMRAIVPVWCILTLVYLKLDYKGPIINFLKRATIFTLAVLPFFAVIPLLEIKYAGAILGGAKPLFDSVYSFFYPFLSSFDPSFLFIKGDDLAIHSTGRHGMMLLASLPLFIFGCYQAVRKRGFWLLVLAAFFLAPSLYGLVGSVHRASRLMAIIPLYSLLSTLGGIWLWQTKFKGNLIKARVLLIFILVLMVLNYFDFLNYYWFTYPKFIPPDTSLQVHKAYEILSRQAKEKQLRPYLDTDLKDGDSGLFFEAIYFNEPIGRYTNKKDQLPSGSILLTKRKEIPGFERLKIDISDRYFQIYK